MNWRRRRRRFRWIPLTFATFVALLVAITAGSADANGAPVHRQDSTSWTAASGTIAPGVSIGGVAVAGLTPDAAAAAVLASYQTPITIQLATQKFSVVTASLGQVVFAQASAGQAMDIGRSAPLPTSGTIDIALRVTVRAGGLERWVAATAKAVLHPPVNAAVSLSKKDVPKITSAKDGYQVVSSKLETLVKAQLVRAAAAHTLGLRTDLLQVLHPTVTTKSLPPTIVIHRGENKLYLYSPKRLVKVYKVATGQAIYPTPLGRFSIVVKQKNPWWYPPTHDKWAKGLKPVPPGPNNPLGTRWMGLSVPGVGIHGTDEPSSIGYSESHGCIRMHIPDAEDLFNRVVVGTPVFIVK